MEKLKRSKLNLFIATLLIFVMNFAMIAPLANQVQAAGAENQITEFFDFKIKDENGNTALNILKDSMPAYSPEIAEYTLTVPTAKVNERWNELIALFLKTTNGDQDTIDLEITFEDGTKVNKSSSWGYIEYTSPDKNLIPSEGKTTVITLTTPANEAKGLNAKTYTYHLKREVVKEENKILSRVALNRTVGLNETKICDYLPEFNADIADYEVSLGEKDSYSAISAIVDQISSSPNFIMDYNGFNVIYENNGIVLDGKANWTGFEITSPDGSDISPLPGQSATLKITTPETEKYGAKTYTWTFNKVGGTVSGDAETLNSLVIKNQDGRDLSGYLIPGFKSEKTYYNMNLPRAMRLNRLDIQGIQKDGSAKVLSGNLILADGMFLEGIFSEGHLIFEQPDTPIFKTDDDRVELEISVAGGEGAEGAVYTVILKKEAAVDSGNEGTVPEDVYFLTTDQHKIRMDENKTFTLDQNTEGHFVYNKAGAAEMSLEWQCTGSDKIKVYADGGEFESTGVDEKGIDVWLTEWGHSEHLADFKIRTVSKKYADFRLKIDDTFVSLENVNIPYSVQGESQKKIQVYALVQGEEQLGYRRINGRKVDFQSTPEGIVSIYNQPDENRGTFGFTAQNQTAVVTAALEEQPELSRSFLLTNEYVPVTGIRFHLPEVFYMDHWNGLRDQWVGIVEAGGVYPEDETTYQIELTPFNATDKNTEIHVDNPDLIIWESLYGNGIVPKGRGEVAITVTSKDNPTYSVTKKVRFEYKVPLEKLTAGDGENLNLKVGDVKKLNIAFSPENTTEKRINWTYDKEGIIGIDSERNGINTLTAVSEGTVKVTGTPVDDTHNLKPITFNVTVESDASGMPDVSEDVDRGIKIAQNYLNAESYVFGDEWHVFALLRSGYPLDQSILDNYYASVEAAVIDPDFEIAKITDIERLVLTLDAMGKDSRNVAGINLIDLIANSDRLESQGSNGLAFALLALDGKKYDIAADALWNRDKIIDSLMKYQNEDGGFTLSSGSHSDVDMTGMVLQALAKYQDREVIKASTDRALDYLRKQMSFQGTFKEGSTESAAQVITALSALGIDPMDPANGFTKGKNSVISGIMQNCVGEEGFAMFAKDQKVNAMSTQQALYGLTAYVRLINGQKPLYDLSSNPSPDELAAQTVTEQIKALGVIQDLTKKDSVVAARTAYDQLTAEQKAFVTPETLKLLTDAEAKIAEFEQNRKDQEAAQAVLDRINTLREITDLNQKKDVEAAREAYNKLTDRQKSYISADFLKILTDAETKIAELEKDALKPNGNPIGKPGQSQNSTGVSGQNQIGSGNVMTGLIGSSMTVTIIVVLLVLAGLGTAFVVMRRRKDS